MSFSPVFNTPPTLPIKASGPSVSAFTVASPGRAVGMVGAARGGGALRDTVRCVTSALTAGVTRGSLHFTEVQESHQASGGIYEEGKGGGRGGGGGDGVVEVGGGGAIGRLGGMLSIARPC